MTEEEKKIYEKALTFATEKHAGQTRIGGQPYITHPVAVAGLLEERGLGINYLVAGLFHDLLEDTDATEEEIREIGGDEVLEAVKRLTKKKGYVMAEYVAAIKENKIAFAVKGADRLHNLRCALVTSEEFKRRYVLESVDWYLGFRLDIPKAVRALVDSMETPLSELPMVYKAVDSWLL